MSTFDPNRPPAVGPEWRANGRASDIPIEPGGEPSPFADLGGGAEPAEGGLTPQSFDADFVEQVDDEAGDPPAPGTPGRLEPDRDALILFAATMFRNADPAGYVSCRVYKDDGTKGEKALLKPAYRLDDPQFIPLIMIVAEQAANWAVPAVFCPPVCTFKNHQNAKTDNLLEGIDISAECDEAPGAAREKLEALLGPATIVVESGGEWIDPETGLVEAKVHLHWRLKKPAASGEDHALLYEARELAANLVSGDPTNKSVVHPIRWPGSWHRKKQPRMAKIVAIDAEREVELADALEQLRKAAGVTEPRGHGSNGAAETVAGGKIAKVTAAIPNDDIHWGDWTKVGLAIWASTKGSEGGRLAFHEWSRKSKKYNEATTNKSWKGFTKSPPTRINFGTLIHMAKQHDPTFAGWDDDDRGTEGFETLFGKRDDTGKQDDPGAHIRHRSTGSSNSGTNGPLDNLVERTATDAGLPFAPDVLKALTLLRRDDRAAFEAIRAGLKKVGCRVGELDKAIGPVKTVRPPAPAGTPNWREQSDEGSPYPSMHNARLAIVAIGVECSYDTFHDEMLFGYADDTTRHVVEQFLGEVSDNGILGLRRLLSDRFGFDLTERHVRDAVVSIALEHCFDPVADMLAEAEANWDGIARLDRIAADYFNCEDTPLNRAFVRKTMIAGVARVRNPGCKFDTILVLEAKEGENKSTAWRVLAGDENFSDEKIIGKDSREVQEQLAGVWIHENAELAGMRKAELETVKAFASRQVDRARPAFGHFLKKQARHSIEVGTTNSDEYLLSQTGNRRFWPMRVLKTIDLDKLKRDRLQLWGEAAHYQSQGEALTIDEKMWPDAGIEQEKRRVKDPWEDVLAEHDGGGREADMGRRARGVHQHRSPSHHHPRRRPGARRQRRHPGPCA